MLADLGAMTFQTAGFIQSSMRINRQKNCNKNKPWTWLYSSSTCFWFECITVLWALCAVLLKKRTVKQIHTSTDKVGLTLTLMPTIPAFSWNALCNKCVIKVANLI